MGRRAEPPAAALAARPMQVQEALRLESPDRLRGPAYRRPTRGVYQGGPVLDHEHAIEVFRTALADAAVLGGPSAAWALGACIARDPEPVEVVYPPAERVRARSGLRVRGDVLLPGEVVRTPLGPATSPARTAFDLARRHPPDRALAWVDAVLRATGTTAAEPLHVLADHCGVRGIRQAMTVLPRADARAESPRESMLRWHLLDAGLPAPVPQFVVLDQVGLFVARLDLAWPAQRVAAEYDGDQHRELAQHRHDLLRHNRLRMLGWTVIQVDAAQLRDPSRVVAQVLHALARAHPAECDVSGAIRAQ